MRLKSRFIYGKNIAHSTTNRQTARLLIRVGLGLAEPLGEESRAPDDAHPMA